MEIKVYAMCSTRSNRAVPNQYGIVTRDGEYFQSYRTTIAFRANDGTITLDESAWNYSRTTSKYLSQWLRPWSQTGAREGIKSGEYKLANLN